MLEPTERPMNERLQVGPPVPTPGIRVEEGRKSQAETGCSVSKNGIRKALKFITLYPTKTSHVTQEGGVSLGLP